MICLCMSSCNQGPHGTSAMFPVLPFARQRPIQGIFTSSGKRAACIVAATNCNMARVLWVGLESEHMQHLCVWWCILTIKDCH